MGSFNETCALSNLPILYDTPVKLLFFTKNPYRLSKNQFEQERGHYYNDQWFVRTPPINAIYDDYGKCRFEHSQTIDLIVKTFQKDLVERPFGWNEYHTFSVEKNRDIEHYLTVASQGRLQVRNKEEKIKDDRIPTWQKIHEILKNNNLPIQTETSKGYNAQPVKFGKVLVHCNNYKDAMNQLIKAKKILEKDYHVTLENEPELHLIIRPLDLTVITDEFVKNEKEDEDDLSVMCMLIREDVWQSYVGLKDEFKSLEEIFEKAKNSPFLFVGVPEFSFMKVPGQIGPETHVQEALRDPNFSEDERNTLLNSIGELAVIESAMYSLNQSWHIVPIGPQQCNWDLRSRLHERIGNISFYYLKEEKNEID